MACCGAPQVAIRPEDRKEYLDALQHASLFDDLLSFQTFMRRRLDETLTEYLNLFDPPTSASSLPR